MKKEELKEEEKKRRRPPENELPEQAGVLPRTAGALRKGEQTGSGKADGAQKRGARKTR